MGNFIERLLAQADITFGSMTLDDWWIEIYTKPFGPRVRLKAVSGNRKWQYEFGPDVWSMPAHGQKECIKRALYQMKNAHA